MFKVSWPYALLSGERLFAVVVCCCHGNGSDGRHVFKVSRRATMLVIAIAMAIVVMGGMCVQSIMAICRLLC